MESSTSGRLIRLLLLLLTVWSGQAPLLLVQACARMPHSTGAVDGSAVHQHSPAGDHPGVPRVHLCCNLCGLLRAGPALEPAVLGPADHPVFTVLPPRFAFAQTFDGLGDVPLLPPALGPPLSHG